MKQIIIVFLSALLSTTNISCQYSSQRLDSLFNSLYSYNQINGNVLIAVKGNVIYKKSFGLADFQKCLPNIDSTAFTMASISKVFTSVAVLQLRDKGKLKLDDLFVKYIPDFPYANITIRNLLSHTSGLPDYDLYEDEINRNPGKIFSNKDILPTLKRGEKPLHFNPGEKWEYSNTNFCLLAILVEKLSGLSFGNYIQRNIFLPVKMYNTYFQSDANHLSDGHKAVNYEYPWLFSAKMQNVDSIKRYRWRLYNASGFVGQGNIMTTTEDLLKFDQALYSGRILNVSTLKEAFVPTKLITGKNADTGTSLGKASYGLGWFILEDTSAGNIVWHTGGQPGGLGIFIRNLTNMQTIIMFDNTFNKSLFGSGFNALAILNDKPLRTNKKSMIQEYGISLVENGADAAFCRLAELRADSTHYYLSEDDMNDLGLQLLYAADFKGHNELALEVLKLNTLLFPGSFNTYDSYGEALASTGKTREAILMYRKSLLLNPGNKSGENAVEELLKK